MKRDVQNKIINKISSLSDCTLIAFNIANTQTGVLLMVLREVAFARKANWEIRYHDAVNMKVLWKIDCIY